MHNTSTLGIGPDVMDPFVARDPLKREHVFIREVALVNKDLPNHELRLIAHALTLLSHNRNESRNARTSLAPSAPIATARPSARVPFELVFVVVSRHVWRDKFATNSAS